MPKLLCPFTSKPCVEEKCVVWGRFLTVNPKTGQPTGDPAGEGCVFFNKIMKEAKK